MSKYYEKILRYAGKGFYTPRQIETLEQHGAITQEEKETILAAMDGSAAGG